MLLFLAADPPLGVPPAFWPALCIAALVAGAFVREVITPGRRTIRAEARADASEMALRENVPALVRSNDMADRVLKEVLPAVDTLVEAADRLNGTNTRLLDELEFQRRTRR